MRASFHVYCPTLNVPASDSWNTLSLCVRPSHFVSNHYLCNHTLYCFNIRTVNSPQRSSWLIIMPSCSNNSLPNAVLWLVDSFPTIISATTHHIASILELWTHLSDTQTFLAYCHAPVMFCQMLAFDWLLGFWPLFPQSPFTLHSYWNCKLTREALRPDQHTVMPQWFSAKCRPMICQKVHMHYLHSHALYCFHIGSVNSPQWVSQLIIVLTCSSDFLLPETKFHPPCGTLLDVCFSFNTAGRQFWNKHRTVAVPQCVWSCVCVGRSKGRW